MPPDLSAMAPRLGAASGVAKVVTADIGKPAPTIFYIENFSSDKFSALD
jgi:hypothetical protein